MAKRFYYRNRKGQFCTKGAYRKRFYYRNRKGQFCTKGAYRKRQQRILKRAQLIIGRNARRVLQAGPVEIEVRGYYAIIEAVIPATFDTPSTPVFDSDPDSEQYHRVIWPTHIRGDVAGALAEYERLLNYQTSYGRAVEAEVKVLGGELFYVTPSHDHISTRKWRGNTIPRLKP
jgi:hypothetical protein